jgi:hypothetical protein
MAVEQFTEREIETLRKGASGAGMLVAISDKSFFDTSRKPAPSQNTLCRLEETPRAH